MFAAAAVAAHMAAHQPDKRYCGAHFTVSAFVCKRIVGCGYDGAGIRADWKACAYLAGVSAYLSRYLFWRNPDICILYADDDLYSKRNRRFGSIRYADERMF